MSAIHWARLTIAADQVDDAERLRIATENRFRALVDDKHLAQTPEAKALEAQVEAVKAVEKIAVLELRRAMRTHPLGEWCKAQVGVGEKTLARLLGTINDPAYRLDPETGELHSRTLSQLRSYCGYGDAAVQRRRKGEKANWSAEARKRLYLIAEACMKQRCETCREAGKEREEGEGWQPPPAGCSCVEDGYRYRAIFDEARASWVNRDTSDAHRRNHALRIVVKAFLKDLWLEARRVHGEVEVNA